MDQTIARCGVQDALVYADRDFRLTWYEFGKLVDNLACGLMAMGIKKGVLGLKLRYCVPASYWS